MTIRYCLFMQHPVALILRKSVTNFKTDCRSIREDLVISAVSPNRAITLKMPCQNTICTFQQRPDDGPLQVIRWADFSCSEVPGHTTLYESEGGYRISSEFLVPCLNPSTALRDTIGLHPRAKINYGKKGERQSSPYNLRLL